MKIIFWQNMISQHLYPLLQGIKEVDSAISVLLVVEQEISEKRLMQGWCDTDFRKLNISIIVNPNLNEVERVFSQNNKALHVFSGIRSNKLVFKALKISYKFDVKRYLISESPTFYKIPRILHYLKTMLLERKYIRRFEKVYAIGTDAYNWFSIWSKYRENIIPFSYCINDIQYDGEEVKLDNGKLKCVFVGRLVKLKGVKSAISQIVRFKDDVFLDVIGHGPEFDELNKLASNSKNIQFKGKMANIEIRKSLLNYDVLILPSYYDGWGAVVNEALMAGCYVVVSDNCGASSLIMDDFNGKVFSHKGEDEFYRCVKSCKENLISLRGRRNQIVEWSNCIKRDALAKYFLLTITSNESIIPPWKKLNYD